MDTKFIDNFNHKLIVQLPIFIQLMTERPKNIVLPVIEVNNINGQELVARYYYKLPISCLIKQNEYHNEK